MALTRLNYEPGVFEAATDETLDDSPVLNTWYNFSIDEWKHVFSDIVLKQGGTAIPTSAYELSIDTKYTDREAGESGKTLYAQWRIVDNTYAGITTTISGNNFGTYVDNETVKSKIDATKTLTNVEAVPSSLQTFNAGVWTKALFATENTDSLGEYDTTQSRFVPDEDGTYTFEVLISIPQGSGGTARRIMAIATDGSFSAPINYYGYTANGATTDYIRARITMDCVTTSYYEVYFIQQTTSNLTQVANSNILRIYRQITSI